MTPEANAMPNADRRVVVREDVLMTELEGQAVLLDLDSEEYFGLNETGTHMWNVLCNTDTVQEAYARLKEQYDVGAKTLKADLDRFLEELSERNLIVIERPGRE